MQPGNPGQNPYGQQPPYGQEPSYSQPQDPYAPPQDPYVTPQDPYGQPLSGQPQYGPSPTSGSPYDQPSYPGAPQSPGPLSSGLPQYPTSAPGHHPPGAPPPQYAAAGFGLPGPPTGQDNTFGLVGMILGIVGLVMAFCCTFLGPVLGIAAVVLGILGRNKVRQGLADNSGQVTAAIICGVLATLLAIAIFIAQVALNFSTFDYNNI